MNRTKQQSIDVMQSLKLVQSKVDPVLEMWTSAESEEHFYSMLTDAGYEFIMNSDKDKITLPNSLVFTPEDDPADNCYYTPDGDKLQPIFMEKVNSVEYLDEEDGEDGCFWNVQTLREHSDDFTDCVFSIALK